MADAFNRSSAYRVHAAELYDLADQKMDIDVELFVDYLAVSRSGDEEGARFFKENMFSPEMKKAVEAWEATDPFNNQEAPATPMRMPEYKNEDLEKAKEMDRKGGKSSKCGRIAIEHADRYVLLTVLFASVLFWAGISTKFSSANMRIIMLGFGGLFFLCCTVAVFFQPLR